MFKKKCMFLLGFSLLSSSYAGGMGAVEQSVPSLYPYIGADASYTWNGLNASNLTSNATPVSLTSQGWGGRLSAGVMWPHTEKFGFNAEIAGGYYGSDHVVTPSTGAVSRRSIDGYDVLAGVFYQFSPLEVLNPITLFGDAGFMVQNYRVKRTYDVERVISGFSASYSGSVSTTDSTTQVLPELKVGGLYHLRPNLAFSLAYLHVFGVNPSGTTNASENGDRQISIVSTTNMQNPTLNTILFGLRYSFA